MPDAMPPATLSSGASASDASTSDFAPRARRSAFKHTDKGSLYLQFDPHHVLAVRSSPPRVWRKQNGGTEGWKGLNELPFELNGALRELATADAIAAGELAAESLERWQRPSQRTSARIRRENLARFFAEVDPFVRSVIGREWGRGSWSLFCLLQTSAAARDLCKTDDGMRVAHALSLARWLLDERVPKRALAFARRWAGKKRRDILGRLGFPATAASVKALAKVPLAHLSVHSLRLLRSALCDDDARERAQHLQVLPVAVLEVLSAPALRAHVDHAFLVELGALDAALQAPLTGAGVLRDTVQLAAQLNRELKVFSSFHDLVIKHNELVNWAQQVALASAKPLPPLPIELSRRDLQVARLLRSGLELLEEGRRMHHCLGSMTWHHEAAYSGDLVVFAVHHPERLTLALARIGGAAWGLYDLAGPHNAPPPPEVDAWVHDLLARLNAAPRQLTLQLGA